ESRPDGLRDGGGDPFEASAQTRGPGRGALRGSPGGRDRHRGGREAEGVGRGGRPARGGAGLAGQPRPGTRPPACRRSGLAMDPGGARPASGIVARAGSRDGGPGV
ncbi:MAG: hypothetical protein AVDCRST_MAG02-1267, partial [uncultured Rubrobacteraceae bacterium]